MEDTLLFAAAEALVSSELGVDTVCRSDCDSCFLYGNTYIEVLPTERIVEQEPPVFNIQWAASERLSDICVFTLKNRLFWDFYIVKSSVIDSCFGGITNISLPLIEPFSLHAKVGGIKRAIDLACNL